MQQNDAQDQLVNQRGAHPSCSVWCIALTVSSHNMNSPALFAPTRKSRLAATVGISAVLAIALTATGSGAAHAAEATVGLGVATSYGVLAYTKIENTGLTVIDADIALSPTDASFITGPNSPVVPTDVSLRKTS